MNIVRFIWRKLYHIFETTQLIREIKKKYDLRKKVKNIVIFGTPNHGNLGDYAIYLAEKRLLEEYQPDSHVFDINMAVFNREVETLTKLLKKDDVLILTGGGNLGNQYMDDENIRRKVITLFPNNRIVIFPQTIFFTDDIIGQKEREISRGIYNRHPHLLIAARDEFSYMEMKKTFSSKIYLVPDVVLTWGSLPSLNRSGALMVLRSDVESTLLDKQISILENYLGSKFSRVEKTDTVIDDAIAVEGFKEALYQKWKQFQQAELVVTDRLHGMIFAAISQTPCLVLNNYNHKLKETYKWVKNLGYIQFLTDMNSLEESIDQLKLIDNCKYDMEKTKGIYNDFLKEIFYG